MNAKVRIALLVMVLAGAGGYYYWSGMAEAALQGRSAVAHDHGPNHNHSHNHSASSTKLGPAYEDERAEIQTEVSSLIQHREFDKLEAMAKAFRENDEKTKEGWSKLTSFYLGTSNGLNNIEQHSEMADVEALLDEWKKEKPESLTQIIVKSNYLIRAAWRARGSGYANTVREEQWKVFFELLNRAQLTVAEAGKITDEFDPYSLMVYLTLGKAMGADTEQMSQLVAIGMEKYPSYEGTYREMAAALLPRWGGEVGDVESFADYVRENLPEPLGDVMYARIAGNVWNYEGSKFFDNTVFPYEKVRDCYLTLIEEYPEGSGNKQVLARLAVSKQDATTAHRMFEEVGPWPADEVEKVWGSVERYEQLMAWAAGESDNPLEVTPLETAVTTGDIDAVTSAIANGGDVNRHSSKGTPLITLALEADNLELATLLADNGADLTAKGPRNFMVVTAAAKAEHLDILDKAIEQNGMNVNDPVTPNEWNLLHVAAYYDCPKTVEHLIVKHGADVEARNNRGSSPIFLSSDKNSVDTAKVLLKHGANVNSVDNKNITPLHHAAWAGSAETVKLFLKMGADPTITSNSGVDALTAAKAQHQAETTKLVEEALAKHQ